MLAPRRGRLSAGDAAAGLGRAGPRGLVAGDRGGARGAARRAGTPARDRALGPDARARRARRPRPRAAPRDPLERPAHRRRVPRDRGDRRARAADRADRQPRPAGVHRAQAAVAAPPRARGLARDGAGDAAQGLRPAAAVRRARHRRLGRLGDAAARRRRAALERRCSTRSSSTPRILPAVLESPAVSGTARIGGTDVPVAAGAGDQAAGALGVGVARPGALSVVLGTSGVVFAAGDTLRGRPAGPGARLLPRPARQLARDGRDAVGRGLAGAGRATCWPRDRLRRSAGRRRGLAAGRRGADVPSLPGRRAHPARRPRRARRVRRARPAPRPRRAGASRAGGRGLRAARLAGPDPRARDRGSPAGRVSGGGARSELWLRIVASVLELPLERVAVEEGAAFGAAILAGVAGGVFDDVDAGRRRDRAPGERRSSRWPSGSRPTAPGTSAYRALYPALRAVG